MKQKNEKGGGEINRACPLAPGQREATIQRGKAASAPILLKKTVEEPLEAELLTCTKKRRR